jgi:hypothetical protein
MDAIKLIKIADLQPTDTLREQNVGFLETLNPMQIANYGLIWVLGTSIGDLITEGNNRTAVLARKGMEQIRAKYIDFRKVDRGYLAFLDMHLDMAEQLRRQGIYSVYDLWQA